MRRNKNEKGISVVEVMIGLVILSLIFVFVFHTLTLFFNSQKVTLESTQALYLAEEAQESLRFLRDENWATLAAIPKNTEYALALATTTISTGVGTENVHGVFTRSFVINDAYRNSDDEYVASTTAGAAIDPDTLQLTVRVVWGNDGHLELHSLLTNLHDR